MTLFLARTLAGPTLANAAINPRIAVQVSQPLDHRTLQLKGALLRTRDALPEERAYVQRFVEELAAAVDQVGMPRERVVRMSHWPAVALEVRIEAIYLQTPGPGAGQPLAGRAP